MRVTWNNLNEPLVSRLNQIAQKQSELQLQAAGGQRITNASDDPGRTHRVLDLTAEARQVAQFQRNIESQKDLATATQSALQALKTISDRAGEIATLADGTRSRDELSAYATEVQQLIEQALQVANRQHGDVRLFGGTRTADPPFVAARDPDGRVTAVAYQGNENTQEVEVAEGVTLAVLTPGANAGGTGLNGVFSDARTGADFFEHLIALEGHLRSGDVAAITSTDRPGLQRDEDNLILHLARTSSLQKRLEVSATQAEDRALALESETSREADADLATVLTELSATQTAYQAALFTSASLLDQSLLDYLR